MRGFVPGYDIRQVESLKEAMHTLATEPGTWKLFAGGTDLMVVLESGRLSHRRFLSIFGLPELSSISYSAQSIRIGAGVTYADLRSDHIIRAELPMLVDAAALTGAWAIQNRGTLGGNIVNASPAADSPPALLAYGASVELASVQGSRIVPLEKFYTGYKQMVIRPDEVLVSIHVPRIRQDVRTFHAFKKVGTREAQAITKVSLAMYGVISSETERTLRIAVGSVTAFPKRCESVETMLSNGPLTDDAIVRAAKELERSVAPIDDIRSNAHYRRKVLGNIFTTFCKRVRDGT